MASRFQASILVSSPSYPNSIAWSDENLVAVACGPLVTVLNPASPFGPRGVIKVPPDMPFPIGVIKREELPSRTLFPISLSRDCDPCIRSISWSPLGMASNYGCLLAICTVEGRVKLYRAPFCDYTAEWIELIDISDQLCDYLASVNFNELETSSSDNPLMAVSQRSAAKSCKSSIRETKKRKPLISCSNNVFDKQLLLTREDDGPGFSPTICTEAQGHTSPNVQIQSGTRKRVPNFLPNKSLESSVQPLVSACQYSSRRRMLSSLVVSWSPLLHCSTDSDSEVQNGTSSFSVLAVGGKSGKLFFWKINEPNTYSIEHGNVLPMVMLLGFLQAHSSWVTAISWAVLMSKSSDPQVLLVTGSSDGSVKIWLGNFTELVNSTEVRSLSFVLLHEIITSNGISVSVLSATVPVSSPVSVHLAVGKVSGSFDIWICDISNSRFNKTPSEEAHDQAVTGFAWAFDGHCLYSCSQDNTVRSWMIRGCDLCEVAIPPGIPGQRDSRELPNAFYSCFGLAVSPGNLVLAMVRSFDGHLLNPMYQARSYKAAVEYLWIGGQHHGILSKTLVKENTSAVPNLSEDEICCWKFNMLWSLKQFEVFSKPLTVWDAVAALLAFKHLATNFVFQILFDWISAFCKSPRTESSIERILPSFLQRLSEVSSRRLHLLNIICRRVVLSESKNDQEKLKPAIQEADGEKGQFASWLELVVAIEKELLERLVAFSFACPSLMSRGKSALVALPGSWYPFGLAQMEQWVAIEPVKDQLKAFVMNVCSDKTRLPVDESTWEEQCPHCQAPVPFTSPESASCRSIDDNKNESHKLVRCSVSMQRLQPEFFLSAAPV
ncbi:hypothetical protein MLD38_031327 [Melastoma candidum]|uniref:Uncharacterized protein n=1 Tax=Melastoma candidum TaxID=119954 RepID=A0ACB9MR88_9MYRT|nr:hypothetical protein MLD38_031327 [Melastoma candidum]